VYDGRPLDGVAVAVGAAGGVRIGGPTVFSGYLGRPVDTDAVLSQGWFSTADRGRIDDDGLLRILGRTDDVVVSGGVNVALPEVAERLLAHPDVADAVAVGVPDDEWGTAVVAYLVLEPDDADGPTDWRGWVAAGLGRAHAPRRVVAVAAIPMLRNGKPDRQELARRAAELLSQGSGQPE
jgi:O-succinylbenzoic acid--CoA ligase